MSSLALTEMRAIALEIARAFGAEASQAVLCIERNDDWWRWLPKVPSPSSFETAESYFAAVVPSKLFGKFQDFPIVEGSDSPERAAYRKWLDCEKQCSSTNRRFYDYFHGGPLFDELPDEVKEFLLDLRKEVRMVMGKVPNRIQAKFGPGSTLTSTGVSGCTVPTKICTVPSLTPSAWPFVRDFQDTSWARNVRGAAVCEDVDATTTLQFYRGDKLEFAPKSWDVSRPITIGPSLNVFYQLAYGSYLKKRLRSYGQLLTENVDWLDRRSGRDSKKIHMELARLASITGDDATIDLKSASDTVAYWFVKWCCSDSWFKTLDSLRCPVTTVRGSAVGEDFKERSYLLEKFSSMGNGYTFEVETTLFFCIARVTLRKLEQSVSRVRTFGDDLIVPTNCYRDVCAALRFCGFSINPDKSFATGPFRESCGGDYYRGTDVRPPSISGIPRGPVDWIVVHNQLKRLVGRVKHERHLEHALDLCINNVPSHLRCFGPVVLGDEVLHSEPHEPNREWTIKMKPTRSEVPRYTPRPHPDKSVWVRDKSVEFGVWLPHVRCVKRDTLTFPWERWDDDTIARSKIYGLLGSEVAARSESDISTGSPHWVLLPLGVGSQA